MKNLSRFLNYVSYTSIGVFLLISCLFFMSYATLRKERGTRYKLYRITYHLNHAKEQTDTYPTDLYSFEHIKLNTETLLLDSWGNPIHYERLENGNQYLLFSYGKDGIANTDDDIQLKK